VSKIDERQWQGWGVPGNGARYRGPFPAFPEPPVTERCAYCSFTVSAPLEEAREAFQAHECGRPRPVTSKRRRSGFALH
jgi:hypothetical protein